MVDNLSRRDKTDLMIGTFIRLQTDSTRFLWKQHKGIHDRLFNKILIERSYFLRI